MPPAYDVIKTQGQTSAVRLGFYANQNSEMDEAVLRYQGIIFDHTLPPVKKMQRSEAKHRDRALFTFPIESTTKRDVT